MGKDRRSERKRCLRCTQWAEDGSELCIDCEFDAVEEMARLRVVDSATEEYGFSSPTSTTSRTRNALGNSGLLIHFSGSWQPTFTVLKGQEGYAVIGNDYLDALDQERASSLEGGE